MCLNFSKSRQRHLRVQNQLCPCDETLVQIELVFLIAFPRQKTLLNIASLVMRLLPRNEQSENSWWLDLLVTSRPSTPESTHSPVWICRPSTTIIRAFHFLRFLFFCRSYISHLSFFSCSFLVTGDLNMVMQFFLLLIRTLFASLIGALADDVYAFPCIVFFSSFSFHNFWSS